jgi:hypothetical protein
MNKKGKEKTDKTKEINSKLKDKFKKSAVRRKTTIPKGSFLDPTSIIEEGKPESRHLSGKISGSNAGSMMSIPSNGQNPVDDATQKTKHNDFSSQTILEQNSS